MVDFKKLARQARSYKFRSTDTVDFDLKPIVEGHVEELGVMEIDGEERSYLIIDTGYERLRVFHSKALTEAFDMARKGDSIKITFNGKIPIGGKKTFNKFSVQLWTGGEDEEKEEAPQAAIDPSQDS